MTAIEPQHPILILGGGQLARMFADAAAKLKIPLHIYAQDFSDSATRTTQDFSVGSLNDESKIAALFAKYKTASFENEFIPYELYKRLATQSQTSFVPSLDGLALTQDKLEQKKLFVQLNIPTAEYTVFESHNDNPDAVSKDLKEWLDNILKDWNGAVLKWSRFGYDGKGNLVIDKSTDLKSVFLFYNEGRSKGAQLYAERKIDFSHEVAIQVVHGRKSGGLLFYPLVITLQKSGVCSQVLGPATSCGIDSRIEVLAQGFGAQIANAVPLEGLFAVEGFVTSTGNFLINEIAPRVHNSGHYTQHASNCSQFENHLRAVAGMPLVSPQTAKYFGMINILGPFETGNLVQNAESINLFAEKIAKLQKLLPQRQSVNTTEGGEFFYWYDKKIRHRRKLGHINFWSTEKTEMTNRMNFWKEQLKSVAE